MATLSDESIAEELQKYPSYFEVYKKYMDISLTKDFIEMKIGILMDLKETDPISFETSPAVYNALSFFLFQGEHYHDAIKYNNYVQDKWPRNITAKRNAIFMYLQMNKRAKARRNFEELSEFTSQAVSSNIFQKETLLAEAEGALFFKNLTIHEYTHALKLYQQFLDAFFTNEPTGNLHLKERPKIQIEECELTWWCFQIIRLYNVMVNEGRMYEYDDDFKKSFDPKAYFRVIYSLCNTIINLEEQSGKRILSGRAYVELADVINKLWYGYRIDITTLLGKDITARECINFAYNSTPSDPYVLEHVGRYYRKSAKSKHDLLKAVDFLKLCVDYSPKRHVAWHHLGLSYRALWIIDNNFPEKVALLKEGTSRSHRGHINHRQYTQNQRLPTLQNQYQSRQRYRQSATSMPQQTLKQHRQFMKAPQQEYQMKSLNERHGNSYAEQPDQMVCCDTKTVGMSQKGTPSYTIQKLPLHKAAPQYTTMSIYDLLLSSNPKSHSCSKDTYLHQAKDCFMQACHIMKDRACPYLVDLGRAHISLQQSMLAEKMFIKASKIAGISARDKQILYEQWALFKLLQVTEHDDEKEDILEDAKELCKMSVKWAAETNCRSRIAYFKLKDTLENEIKRERNRTVRRQLLKDKVYLHQLVGQLDEALTSIAIWLDNDPDDSDFVWDMVAIYNRQEIFDEAHEWLQKAMGKHADVLSVSRRELAIEVTIRSSFTKSCGVGFVGDLFRVLYSHSLQAGTHKERFTLTEQISAMSLQESDKSDICSGGVVPCEENTKPSTVDLTTHIVILGYDRFDDVIQFAEAAFKDAGLNIFTHNRQPQ